VTVDKILAERPSKHGEFVENSRATWEIMRVLQGERNWPKLTDPEKHALYMVAHKMARIMAGDPKCEDHWDDIAGYATLVADRIRQPIVPYDADEIYAALAIGWGVTREEAAARVQTARERADARPVTAATRPSVHASKLQAAVPGPRPVPAEPTKPGTPEDGGHYSIDQEALERELENLSGEEVATGANDAVQTREQLASAKRTS
jgi:hypothetical protein